IFYYFIPPGNYDVVQLANTLETGINKLVFEKTHISEAFSVQVDLITGVFKIVANHGLRLNWIFGRDTLTTDSDGFIIKDVQNPNDETLAWRQLWRMLGFPTSRTYSLLQLALGEKIKLFL